MFTYLSYQVRELLVAAGVNDAVLCADIDAYIRAASDYTERRHRVTLGGEPQRFHHTIRR